MSRSLSEVGDVTVCRLSARSKFLKHAWRVLRHQSLFMYSKPHPRDWGVNEFSTLHAINKILIFIYKYYQRVCERIYFVLSFPPRPDVLLFVLLTVLLCSNVQVHKTNKKFSSSSPSFLSCVTVFVKLYLWNADICSILQIYVGQVPQLLGRIYLSTG